MKIAVFHNLPPGGAKRTIYEQVKYLSKNHEIHLYRLSDTNEDYLGLYPFAKSIHSHDFSFSPHRLISDYQKFVVLNTLHRKMARDVTADVALIHSDRHTQSPFILKYLKIPSLYFCQELLRIAYEPELAFNATVNFFKRIYELETRRIKKIIDRINAQAATRILANSGFTRNNVQIAYNRQAQICRLGVDTNLFRPSTTKKNQILFVDQVEKMSGYGLLMSALDLIPKKNRPLLKVLSFSKDQPAINANAIAKEYSRSIATICASINEPFGLPSIESQSCQTPVLAVDEGGYRETVVDGVTGWLLPRYPQAFADKISFLRQNPGIIKKMGAAGRQHVIKNFTWDRHTHQVEKTLYELAAH